MAWVYLIIGGLGEVIGVAGINQVNQKKSLSAFMLLIGGFIMSFVFLSLAMKALTMSTAYSVWTGIGTIGSAGIGILFFGESKHWRRLLFMAMILVAVIGLKVID